MQTEEKKVRKKLTGGRYLMLETRKDGTKFTSRALKEAAERLQAISRSYDQRQHALVEQVCFYMQTFRRHKSTATSLYKSHAGPAEVFFATAIVPVSSHHVPVMCHDTSIVTQQACQQCSMVGNMRCSYVACPAA